MSIVFTDQSSNIVQANVYLVQCSTPQQMCLAVFELLNSHQVRDLGMKSHQSEGMKHTKSKTYIKTLCGNII